MLITLGARATGDDAVDLLAACHRRIRQHVVLARTLVAVGATRPADEVRETAAQIARYFAVALPLHVADEDESVVAALATSSDPAIHTALATLVAEHADHRAPVDRLVELCEAIAAAPASLAELAPALAALVDRLGEDFAHHLDLEERVVFPALRTLPDSMRTELRQAIRRRRTDGIPGSA